MKSNKKHIFGKILLLCISLFLIASTALFLTFFVMTKDEKLDVDALSRASSGTNIELYFNDGTKIDSSSYFSSCEKVSLSELNDYTINAFIATEDKRFYSHNGIDFKRIVGAMVSNLKKGKFSEGGSTISQQLIKNTHLSREKTLKRKIKEIKLALDLEKKFSKEEILEMYLSSIYFGNGCYGIKKASSFYFNKDVNDLTLGESALLASVINAPSFYDPINKNENAEKRKNLVLKNMLKLNYITNEEYEKNANSTEKIVKNASKSSFSQIKPILSEASKILKSSESLLKNRKIKIKTTLSRDICSLSENAINSVLDDKVKSSNIALLVVDNNSKSIVAFSSTSKMNLLSFCRQPGSTIKPILVYAPAIESGLIYPESIIIDEPININGYAPQNASKTYSGAVSVRYALEKSLNIPAVKTLSNLSVNKAKEFAKKLSIEFENGDNNLALALGGMSKGVTLKNLADAYSSFATEGVFQESDLISEIVDENDKVIYKSSNEKIEAMDKSTAYLISDMLSSVAKTGTAKRLNSLPFDVYAKTGTVGKKGSSLNTDAFSIAYTKDHTLVAWIGAQDDSLKSGVNGSNYPTEIIKNALLNLYKEKTPNEIPMPDNVSYLDIDTRALEGNKVELATESTPVRYRKQALFSLNHLPEVSLRTFAEPTELSVVMEEMNKPTLEFLSKVNFNYMLQRENLKTGEKVELERFSGTGEKLSYLDSSAETGDIYEYTLFTYSIFSPEKENFDERSSVKLMSF